eukprot:CAMPEP_0167755048 /NCGR_PEP_ID=MMETSP0110_2-20121227/8608_1 /TAXON_ID=629695 /ORGANISM="Gymnochlora sp., Strain CCMP2014" /LENGTH=332 /DNA_ID=CAMNT_0007640993 /DNA_START=105 /DNA_END=1103 /DNA_ORIENTATION=-
MSVKFGKHLAPLRASRAPTLLVTSRPSLIETKGVKSGNIYPVSLQKRITRGEVSTMAAMDATASRMQMNDKFKSLRIFLFQLHLCFAALAPAIILFPPTLALYIIKVLSFGLKFGMGSLIDIIVRFWAILSLRMMGIKVQVEGIENLPKEGEIVVTPNHASYLDIFVLSATLPRLLKYVVKSELFKLPIWGWGMYMADHVGIPRGDGRAGIKALNAALNTVKERVKKGGSYIIFPEGTRSRNGRLQSFKRGAFSVAGDTDATLVPVSLVGVNEAHTGTEKYTTVPVANPKNIRVVVHEGKKLGDEGAKTTTEMRDWAYQSVKSSLRPDQLPE